MSQLPQYENQNLNLQKKSFTVYKHPYHILTMIILRSKYVLSDAAGFFKITL